MTKRGKETILITGGNGFTGRHACRYFAGQGFHVVSMARSVSDENHEIQKEICELTNAEETSKLIQRIKPAYVLHLAGQSNAGESWSQPVTYMESNVMATLFLLEAIRKHSPSCKVVITGSILQYPIKEESLPPHPYSLSKTLQVFASKSWANYYDLNIVIAKPTNLIGPGPSTGVCSILAKRVAKFEKTGNNEVLTNMDLQAKRIFLDVRDAVRAYHQLFIIGGQGREYDVSFGTEASVGEVAFILSSMSNVDFYVPDEKQAIKFPLQLMSGSKELNCTSSITLEQSLADTLDYFRNL
ncbi:MAG: NAD-dependent epimerase/dehydratase family protein [Cytobacillus gottheilii]|uniref:NAD-dependent epimerase/dehydratase family protein n=1 Tax=Cytobacillus gottheilii TaxID=859144 RepID=UPI003463DF89